MNGTKITLEIFLRMYIILLCMLTEGLLVLRMQRMQDYLH